jgi:hypothetical protein
MKKYTNKILIIAAAIFLAANTILFCIRVSEVKKELKEQNTQSTINY